MSRKAGIPQSTTARHMAGKKKKKRYFFSQFLNDFFPMDKWSDNDLWDDQFAEV